MELTGNAIVRASAVTGRRLQSWLGAVVSIVVGGGGVQRATRSRPAQTLFVSFTARCVMLPAPSIIVMFWNSKKNLFAEPVAERHNQHFYQNLLMVVTKDAHTQDFDQREGVINLNFLPPKGGGLIRNFSRWGKKVFSQKPNNLVKGGVFWEKFA